MACFCITHHPSGDCIGQYVVVVRDVVVYRNENPQIRYMSIGRSVKVEVLVWADCSGPGAVHSSPRLVCCSALAELAKHFVKQTTTTIKMNPTLDGYNREIQTNMYWQEIQLD
ncbi:hypothetical protein J6590_009642 [Homalodisca vitripennis]|nr:hypothetical protein J6590_009642 [Homalodisca vitripennis]